MIRQACRGSFEEWINVSEKIRKLEYAEDITKDTDVFDKVIDYNLYEFNKEMGYVK
jgi:hypothetical protein